MAADVRPCLPVQGAPTARNERRGCVQERRSELFALKKEKERRVQLWRHRSGAVTIWRHSSLQAAQLRPALTPFIMAVFEAARLRSRITLVILLCMLHVLTDVCSRRAHRLCSFFINSSNERDGTLLDTALHRPRAAAAASDDACSAQALEMASPAYTLMPPRCWMAALWDLCQLCDAHEDVCWRPVLCQGQTQCQGRGTSH